MERTRDRLAAELRKAGHEHGKADVYEAFAKRAATGEFDDYADTYDCPITQLHMELTKAGLKAFAKRVAEGEFDATTEESDEWAASPAGQEVLNSISKEVRDAIGLGDKRKT
jgi:hypothetical protein